jgi:signal transduction histidine kinase/putative methionine-R-sulfoxide reductase with GAF domain
MSKKHLHNRLEALFAGLDAESMEPDQAQLQDFSGWSWQADALGNYLDCSPEIETVLGYRVSDIIGQPVDQFALTPESQTRVHDCFVNGNFPTEITVTYFASNGQQVPTRLHILALERSPDTQSNGRSPKFHGFTLRLEPVPHTGTHPSLQDRKVPDVKPEPLPSGSPSLTLHRLPDPGILLDGTKSRPASEPLSSAGLSSLSSGKTIYTTNPEDNYAALATPIRLQDHAFGILELIDDQTRRAWSSDDLSLVEQVVDQLALALENAQLFHETQENARRNHALYQASQHLTPASTLPEILSAFIDGVPVEALTNAYWWTLEHEAGKSTPIFKQAACWGCEAGTTKPDRNLQLSGAVFPTLQLGTERRPLLVDDISHDHRIDPTTLDVLASLNARAAAFIPLWVGKRQLGMVLLTGPEPYSFSDREIQPYQSLANQAAVVIENQALFQQTRQALSEMERRNLQLTTAAQVSRAASSILNPETLVQDTVDLVRERFNLYYVGLFLVDQTGEQTGEPGRWAVLRAGTGEAGDMMMSQEHRLRISDQSMVGRCISTAQAQIWRGDEQAKSRFRNPILPDTRSEMALPLISRGDVIGAMTFQSTRPGDFSAADISALQTMADQVANAIQNARQFDRTQAALDETELLYTASAELSTTQTYQDVLTILRNYTILGAQASNVTVHLFDRTWTDDHPPEYLIPLVQWSEKPLKTSQRTPMPLDPRLVAGQMLQENFPTFVTDLENDPRLDDQTRAFCLSHEHARGVLFAPLNVAGNWIGHIIAIYHQPMDFSEHDLRRLTTLVGQAAVVIENLRNTELARQRARQLEKLALVQSALSQANSEKEILSALVLAADPARSPDHITLEYLHTGTNGIPVFAELMAVWSEGAFQPILHVTRSEIAQLPFTRLWMNTPEEAIFIADSQTDIRLDQNTREAVWKDGIGAAVVIPLRSGGSWQGLATYTWSEAHSFTPDELFTFRRVLEPTSEVVARRRAFIAQRHARQDSERRAQEMTLLFSVSQALAGAPLESDEIAGIITEEFATVMNVPECTLYVLDDEGESDQLSILGTYRTTPDDGQTPVEPVNLDKAPVMRLVLQSLKPQTVHAEQTDLDLDSRQYMQSKNAATLLVIPLASKGRAIGAIELVANQHARQFTSEQLNLGMTLANAAAVALENARLYETQRETAERLLEVDTLKTQFLANMSHELRTPLNSIIGFSRVILKGIDGPITPLQEQDLSAIYQSGQHLLSLITDILDLSKIEAGKMDLVVGEFDLHDLIESIMPTALGLTKDKPIELQQDIQVDLPLITGDRTRIRQVLLNLLANAAKFTERGSIRIIARLQNSVDGIPMAYIAVTDSGPGIAAEDQDKLFRPFTQVDASPTRKTGGTGLGLSISRHLVEIHGGQIGVESEPGQGSSFFFTLPIHGTGEAMPGVESG